MNQQTQNQGRQELRTIIGGIFNHILRMEKSNAIQKDDDHERRYAKGEMAGENKSEPVMSEETGLLNLEKEELLCPCTKSLKL